MCLDFVEIVVVAVLLLLLINTTMTTVKSDYWSGRQIEAQSDWPCWEARVSRNCAAGVTVPRLLPRFIHRKGSERNAIYQNKTQHANFRSNLLYQATERHLTIKRWKMRRRAKTLIQAAVQFGGWAILCCFRQSSAWKNFGHDWKKHSSTKNG